MGKYILIGLAVVAFIGVALTVLERLFPPTARELEARERFREDRRQRRLTRALEGGVPFVQVAAAAFAIQGLLLVATFWVQFFDDGEGFDHILDTVWAWGNYLLLFGVAWFLCWVGTHLRRLYERWR